MTLKASNFNKSQQLSTNGTQQVQYQLFRSPKFQQASISVETWFGTRGSEVQILSPRPIQIALDFKSLQAYPSDTFELTCEMGVKHLIASTTDPSPGMQFDDRMTPGRMRHRQVSAVDSSGYRASRPHRRCPRRLRVPAHPSSDRKDRLIVKSECLPGKTSRVRGRREKG